MSSKLCPKCGGRLIGIEYIVGDKYHYDGVSEYSCENNDYREGRFCHEELETGEVEPPFCDGKTHPRVFSL